MKFKFGSYFGKVKLSNCVSEINHLNCFAFLFYWIAWMKMNINYYKWYFNDLILEIDKQIIKTSSKIWKRNYGGGEGLTLLYITGFQYSSFTAINCGYSKFLLSLHWSQSNQSTLESVQLFYIGVSPTPVYNGVSPTSLHWSKSNQLTVEKVQPVCNKRSYISMAACWTRSSRDNICCTVYIEYNRISWPTLVTQLRRY